MSNDQKDRATFSYEADFGAIIGIDTSTKQGAELQVYITKLLSTARAEERAKVMKEVSETPAVAWKDEINGLLFTVLPDFMKEQRTPLIPIPTFKE